MWLTRQHGDIIVDPAKHGIAAVVVEQVVGALVTGTVDAIAFDKLMSQWLLMPSV